MLPLALLPNQEGFKFLGVTKDLKLLDCIVVKNEQGLHVVSGATFKDLVGWLHKQ